MADSPAVRAPLDPREQPILDNVLHIRDDLSLLKQDKSTYVKSQDVMELYERVIAQVEQLNRIRTHKRNEQNRVDTLLDDCFQLISLFFLTIGRNNEAPAVYSVVSTTKRLLDHLQEAAFYTGKDLTNISEHLESMQEAIDRGKANYSPHLVTLLKARVDTCKNILHDLQQYLSKLPPDLIPVHEKLVSILRSLSACNTRTVFPTKEVRDFQQQLEEIEANFEGGSGLKPTDRSIEDQYAERLQLIRNDTDPSPEGRKIVETLLARCIIWAELVAQRRGKIDERFYEVYEKLINIRNQLERLTLTQAWSLRETDLYSLQRQLDRIDESRVDGNFLDDAGNPAELHTQRTLLYLLRKSYAFIYQLIFSSEPVSEALLPVYNQLVTLRRCLLEVKQNGGVSNPRELYPYSMKLNSIDNMRTEGKFMVGNDCPEGQAAVTSLLEECFDIAYELRTASEEEVNGEDKD